jgi:polyphosphate kinase
VIALLALQFADDTKARIIDADQSNRYVRTAHGPTVRAQEATYRFLASRVTAGAAGGARPTMDGILP